MIKHSQITQSNKFAISLQYLKKELSDEVDFLRTDKHESLLQTDNNFFTISPKKKKLKMKLIFCMQINFKFS